MNGILEKKFNKLVNILRGTGKPAIAFSGGLDSTFLVWYAHKLLGRDMTAVTTDTGCMIPGELTFATEFCKRHGIAHHIIRVNMPGHDEFAANGPDRCYYCKSTMFKMINSFASVNGYTHVADGTNADDVCKDRPGLRALTEEKIISPLLMAGFTTKDVAESLKYYSLIPEARESNSCLATRIATGERISAEKLVRVAEAEEWLKKRGFRGVRVKTTGNNATIIVAPDGAEMLEDKTFTEEIVNYFAKLGLMLGERVING